MAYKDNNEKREQLKAWRKANPGKYKEQVARYYLKNRSAIIAARAKRRTDNPEKYREKKLKDAAFVRTDRKINPDKYRAARARWSKRNKERDRSYSRKRRGMPDATRPEPSLCECCGGVSNRKFGMHLDHCHISGAFRGWLCASCNTGMGSLGDSIDGLMNAVRYLERAAKQQET